MRVFILLFNEVLKMEIRHLWSTHQKKKSLHTFYYLFTHHLAARPYSHLCHFLVRRVLEMAQSAVCRWAVIHGWNSCSPHTAIWLFYRCSCLHHFLSPFHSTGNSLHEAKINDNKAFSARRVILSPLKENCIRAVWSLCVGITFTDLQEHLQ